LNSFTAFNLLLIFFTKNKICQFESMERLGVHKNMVIDVIGFSTNERLMKYHKAATVNIFKAKLIY